MLDDLPVSLGPIVKNATDALERRYSPFLAEDVISKAAYRAYHAGRHDALSELMSTQMVAQTLGLTTGRIRQLAQQLDLGWPIGRERLFRAEDVAALRNRTDGRRRTE